MAQTSSTEMKVVNNGYIGAGSVKLALPVIPVVLFNPTNQLSIHTYALLDNGSSNSFCTEILHVNFVRLVMKRCYLPNSTTILTDINMFKKRLLVFIFNRLV